MVQKLGLLVEATSRYGVLLGTGQAIKGEGICKGVVLTIQNIEIVEDFLPLDLGKQTSFSICSGLSRWEECKSTRNY